ncbi:MAG TPA: ATP-grasp domain-containing protein [Gemmatimonadales bacterium]|nr:ATP-grasp domain-containing protein [Gemmatimonadales bacterium]
MTAAAPVLVLDGQTTQALACVRSLGRAGHRVYVASQRRAALAAWSRFCRAGWHLPAETVADYAALRSWARDQGVRIVLPLTERSCLLCNAARADWEAAGITVGCGPDDMLLQVFDKAEALTRARACGMATPATYAPTSLAEAEAVAAEVGFPCVVKARSSYAWHEGQLFADPGVVYVAHRGDLAAAVMARRQGAFWPLVQRYVPGHGLGLSAVCDRGRVVAWFAHERLRDVRPSGSGSSLRRSVPVDPRLREAAARLLADLAWHGPAMFEFRHDDEDPDGPWLIEINGRFWGSLQLAITAGVDLPRQWIAILSATPQRGVAAYWPGVTLRWLWGDAQRLLHVVQGPPPGYPGDYPGVWRGMWEVVGPQPAGTQSETWDSADRWPVVAEWVQGIGELLGQPLGRVRA